MPTRRTWLYALPIVALVAACTASGGVTATTSSPAPSPTTPTESASPSATHGSTWLIVALGDSVPAGTACNCTPYPQLSASGLSVPGVREVAADNRAVGGYTTDDVLGQLTHDAAVIEAVKKSDAIEVQVGANDVGHSSKCGTSVACYAPAIPPMEQNLRAIVRRIDELTAGHALLLVLLDYWSVWLGGKYAKAQGEAYVTAAESVTDDVDAVIKKVAAQTGSAYVDLRAAFKGPDYRYDETHYLAGDGDHPNAAGHQEIAAAVDQVVRAELHLPAS